MMREIVDKNAFEFLTLPNNWYLFASVAAGLEKTDFYQLNCIVEQ